MPPSPSDDLSYRGFGVRVLVSAEASGGALTVIEHALEPGFAPMPFHRHARETETVYVLSGAITAQVGGETRTLQPGESLVMPPGVAHGVWNASEWDARWLAIAAPGGIEAFYREIAGLIPRGASPDVDGVLAAAGRHGLEFDLDSLAELIERHGVRLV